MNSAFLDISYANGMVNDHLDWILKSGTNGNCGAHQDSNIWEIRVKHRETKKRLALLSLLP